MDERSKCPNCGTRHGDKDLTVDQDHCRGCELLHNATANAEDKPGTQYRLMPLSSLGR